MAITLIDERGREWRCDTVAEAIDLYRCLNKQKCNDFVEGVRASISRSGSISSESAHDRS